MPLDNSSTSIRRRLKLGLIVSGAVAGTAFGLAITPLGKIVGGAPPATLGNYLWNAAVFGAIAGIVSPVVSWSVLRRVPLWRTVVEPLGFAIAGGIAAVILGSGVLLLALPPVGLLLGFVHLQRRFSQQHSLLSTQPANDR